MQRTSKEACNQKLKAVLTPELDFFIKTRVVITQNMFCFLLKAEYAVSIMVWSPIKCNNFEIN